MEPSTDPKGLKSFLARHYARFIPNSKFIFILGTQRKRATVAACDAVLSAKFKVLTGDMEIIDQSEVASLILKITPKVDKAVIPLNFDQVGMSFYRSLKPKTVIVTKVDNLSPEWSETIKELPESTQLILNYDDLASRKLAETKANVIFYGTNQNCHIWADNVRLENFKTVFEINSGVERAEIQSQLLGIHQLYPLLSAAAAAIADLPLTTIKKSLEKIEPLKDQLQVLGGYNGSFILDDSSATEVDCDEAFDILNLVTARRRIVVLGDLSGTEYTHRQIGRRIYSEKFDIVILGQGNTKYISDELVKLGFIEDRVMSQMQNPQIVSKLLKMLSKGDAVLIRGNKANKLDEVVKRISKLK